MLDKLEKNHKMDTTKPDYLDLHRDWKNSPWNTLFWIILAAPIDIFLWTHGNIFLEQSKS